MKKIYFHIDKESIPTTEGTNIATTFEDTHKMLSLRLNEIHTTDMAHFSFDLIDLGYDIYLCYKANQIKVEPKMKMRFCEKELRPAHNILKIFLGRVFDDEVGYKREKINK